MPHLQKIYEQYAPQGLKMVAINVIPDQDELVPQWAERGGYTFPILVGANTDKIFADYGMTAAPLNFVLDAEGKIMGRFEGFPPGGERAIEKKIRQTLDLES